MLRRKPRITPSTARHSDASAATFLNNHFGPGAWVFDVEADCWVTLAPDYDGPGRAFRVFCRDGDFFVAVVQPVEVN